MTTQEAENITFSAPRFLSIINLGYLFEAAKAADEQFSDKLKIFVENCDSNGVGNINATRQSLLRSVFIASYAILEQNLDEIVDMERNRSDCVLSLSDLRDNGIKRSITYANKILGKNIDIDLKHWKDIFLIQKIRNHLVHYGERFDNSDEHNKKFISFRKSEYVTLRPEICFTIDQIAQIFNLYIACVDDFVEAG